MDFLQIRFGKLYFERIWPLLKQVQLYFLGECPNLTAVFYEGGVEDWNSITLDTMWDPTDYIADIRYYYSENAPTTEGNFWHYVDDVPTIWLEYIAPAYSVGLEYRSNGDGTCYVSGIGSCTDTDVLIPTTSPEGDTVTSIGNSAFFYCENLTSITIPVGVTSIGDGAFCACHDLTSVIISNSVLWLL